MDERKYYTLLKEKFPTKAQAVTELINLEAILHLPKGTEHFVSDVHGEFTAFDHVLRNGSGSVKEKIRDCFPDGSIDVNELAVLIYYPEKKLAQIHAHFTLTELHPWYCTQISALIRVMNHAGRKYTRSKVRKAIPERFRYIIEELLTEDASATDKTSYIQAIIQKIIALKQVDELIEDLAYTIQRLVVDHLHVVGDIYDRGPAPDAIIDRLMAHHSVDIQWGNHDIIWIAALAGSPLAMINLLRISARYGNLDIIEERYGISLRPLIEYSRTYYQVSQPFEPKLAGNELTFSTNEIDTLNLVQQATAILQFKLEGQLINRRPDFQMQDRAMLEHMDYATQTISIAEKVYTVHAFQGPTIDVQNPTALTKEEENLLAQLLHSFQGSERLKRHMDFLLAKGHMYLCHNGNLLIHGCIPLHENGDFKSMRIDHRQISGKALLDFFERQVRFSYQTPEIHDDLATDLLWYLWTGECSSLFGKNAMTTFERYYIKEKETHIEQKNSYYQLRNQERICQDILHAFGLPTTGHIINGHTPVKEKNGETPIKANGRMLVIDGGFAKSYQKETGIAGYTLLANSYGLQLVAHQPFTSIEDAIENGTDIVSTKRLVETVTQRTTVKQTNIGANLQKEMADLETLCQIYEQV